MKEEACSEKEPHEEHVWFTDKSGQWAPRQCKGKKEK